MEEPPAQVPRHTTSLTRLWRRHDLADSVTKFLPTPALAVLPNLSRSFEQDKFRMLLVAMRGSGAAAACTGALLSTLQTSGRDAGHYHYTWDAHNRSDGWLWGKPLVAAKEASQLSLLQMTIGYTEYPDEHFLRAERTGEYDRSQGLFLHQRQICRSCPRGQRRCVRRVRVQFAYDGPTDNWGRSVGSEFALRGPSSDAHRRGDTVSRNILKFYTKFSSDGLRIICTGGGETRTLLTVPKSRIASQDTTSFEVVTIDAKLNWNMQRAEVRATTRDGPQVHKSCAFQRLPLYGLRVGFFGPGAHMYGDVDVWYYDMPAPTLRCRLPCAPCRDDELRFDVGPGLGGSSVGAGCGTPFFLGDAPLGMPPDSDDADY